MTRIWHEADHPRDREGQFTDKPGGRFGIPQIPIAAPAAMPDHLVVRTGESIEDYLARQPPEEEWQRRLQIPDWADAVMARITPGQDRTKEILRVLQEGTEVEQSELAGGNSADTQVRYYRMPDGSVHGLVYKNHHDEWSADQEVRASALGRAIGAPVLTVIKDPDNPEANYMDLYDGVTPDELGIEDAIERGDNWTIGDGAGGDYTQEWVEQDEGVLLGLFDALWGNSDRHDSNILIANQSLGMVGIDHTHSTLGWAGMGDEPRWAEGPFSRQFADYTWRDPSNPGMYMVAIDNDMHPDDMKLIESRVSQLEHMFTDKDWQDLQRRLAILTAHARGTHRRLS